MSSGQNGIPGIASPLQFRSPPLEARLGELRSPAQEKALRTLKGVTARTLGITGGGNASSVKGISLESDRDIGLSGLWKTAGGSKIGDFFLLAGVAGFFNATGAFVTRLKPFPLLTSFQPCDAAGPEAFFSISI
jgi:hypothetical protein